MKKILLVDGMALLFRSFYATSVHGNYMKTSEGVPTNGVHGFLKHMLTAIQTVNPSHVIACWDMGSSTFRTESFSDYKANRNAPPDELKPQFDLVKSVTDGLEIPNVGLAGYEADDCIGTLACQYKQEAEVIILTGDTDLLQLADENVTIMLLRKGLGNYEFYTPTRIVEEKGVSPSQIIDVKALMGDSSDNYPGVKGIGEKTAYSLIQKFSSIEGILTNLPLLTKAQRTKIEGDLDNLHMSRQLARIHCEVPVCCTLEDALLTADKQQITRIVKEMEWSRSEQFLVLL
ncbi:5'-3' exonuclease H3TH domain-containing protein [Bacillus sp. 165]|uniref:5'-3' exonuclease n=1 Tax=Bacillus sp. 165 TaxID=1529117 RepID=UPI001ADC2228|nr:5'-3' exonuclease H3TH domain-containing protein [Bacillus sp. 165]MBO9128187.1 5'-3' exonuclease [Bacillus sp. 165]